MKKYFALKILILLYLSSFSFRVQAQEIISPKEKKKATEMIIKRLIKKGYAFNVTFNDIENRVLAHKSDLDTIRSVNSFTSLFNKIFDTYNLSHFWIWTPEEVSQRRNNSEIGIGAALVKTNQGYFVTRTTKNGVADKSGIFPGDIITAINDTSIQSSIQLKGQNLEEANIILRRGEDTLKKKVKYFPHPPFSKDTIYFVNDQMAVITINTFRSGVYDRPLVESLFIKAKQAKRVIIDMRSNSGGFSGNVQHLLSMVVPNKTICQYYVHREDHDKFFRKYKRNPGSLKELADFSGQYFVPLKLTKGMKVYQGEVIVLIDERSGSGGDVFPACIQDIKRGLIVGNKSAGRVLAGDSYELPTGMTLFYPSGESIRLDGTRLEGNGCVPDVYMSREKIADTKYVIGFLESYDIE